MPKLVVILMVLFISGCTHLSVSDSSMLSDDQARMSSGQLVDFPININAEMSCYTYTAGSTMNGVLKKTQCSNRGRIIAIDKTFRGRGLKIIPANDPSLPTISIQTHDISGFLEGITGFFNLMTFGVLPLYHYTDYKVSYTSTKENINISKTIRISSTISWFSLLLKNPKGLNEQQIQSRVELNLIKDVLNDANVGR